MRQKVLAEFFGTAFLLMIVVGSGISGELLASGNEALALLANSLATGAGLFVLIQALGSVSGAHFNPIVTLVERLWGRLDNRSVIFYWGAQFIGAIVGVCLVHVMFDLPVLQVALKQRSDMNLGFSEIIATFGLVATIGFVGKWRSEQLPLSVALYITSAYWFTSSTSFANPAVTIARSLTNTFCGIAPGGIILFILAQIVGAVLAGLLVKNVFFKTH